MMIGKTIVRWIDAAVNYVVLAVFLVLFAYGCYAMWDASTIYKAADASKYETYKPTDENPLSFSELQAMNPEVMGWLNVYDTHIDYPLVQGDNNDKYINTDAKGNYALSGALFLDYRSDPHFKDFNTIIYGHHMEKKKMFGEISAFRKKAFFDKHRYGSVYYDGMEHGLEFFAFMEVDAYNTQIYNPKITGETRDVYLQYIEKNAINQRQLGVTSLDHLVILSTCASDSTNGRELLIGRLTDKVYKR